MPSTISLASTAVVPSMYSPMTMACFDLVTHTPEA